MLWAAMVAAVSTLGFLLAAARLTDPLGRWAKYLVPPAVLSLGALDWSLFSGMENAFHLGMWALTLSATLRVIRAARRGGGVRAGAVARVARLARGARGRAALPHAAGVGDLRGGAGRLRRVRGAARPRERGVPGAARAGHAGAHRRARCVRGRGAGAGQPLLHRRVGGQRRHRQAHPERPLHALPREVGRVPLPPQVRRLPEHGAPLLRGRRRAGRLGLAGAGGGARPALRPAHAEAGDPPLGERARLARAGGAEPPGPLAERALHHVRGRLGPGALRHGPRRDPEPRLQRRSPPGSGGAERAPEPPSASPPPSPWSGSTGGTSSPRCATRCGSSAAPAATSATSTSWPATTSRRWARSASSWETRAR